MNNYEEYEEYQYTHKTPLKNILTLLFLMFVIIVMTAVIVKLLLAEQHQEELKNRATPTHHTYIKKDGKAA